MLTSDSLEQASSSTPLSIIHLSHRGTDGYFEPYSILTVLADIRAVALTHSFIHGIIHSLKTYLIPAQSQT